MGLDSAGGGSVGGGSVGSVGCDDFARGCDDFVRSFVGSSVDFDCNFVGFVNDEDCNVGMLGRLDQASMQDCPSEEEDSFETPLTPA